MLAAAHLAQDTTLIVLQTGLQLTDCYCMLAVSNHQTLQAYGGRRPILSQIAFVAPNASLIGDVTVGHSSSIWYGAVLRGNTPLHECQLCVPMTLPSLPIRLYGDVRTCVLCRAVLQPCMDNANMQQLTAMTWAQVT